MNPTFFIKIIDGKLILWDYKKHNQFEITQKHLMRILVISRGSVFNNSQIDCEICASSIFETCDNERWGWDILSYIFHIGTQMGLGADQDLPPMTNTLSIVHQYSMKCPTYRLSMKVKLLFYQKRKNICSLINL